MAAARAPGPADARIPCPLCSGLIHPIAGRCKHCKGDLTALRQGRPAAAAALPALNAAAAPGAIPVRPAGQAPNPYAIANGHSNGHTAAPSGAPRVSPSQIAQAAAAYQDASQPILPPRPTGRMPAAPIRASWKSWPVIVIILAVIAIVTAVVLMVWPPGASAEAEPASVQPVPAPERMETNPLPPSSPPPPAKKGTDPWSSRDVPAPADPADPADPPVGGRRPAPDIDDPNLQDPLGGNPFSRRGGTLGIRGNFGTVVMSHACQRLSQCGSMDPGIKMFCDLAARRLPRTPAPSCPAAQRCLAHIDALDCDTDFSDASSIAQVFTQFSDCGEALSC